MYTLLLGSRSPRRRELIRLLGLPVATTVADADEDGITIPDPVRNVLETARLKARIIAAALPVCAAPTLLLTADTTVALDGRMLNKPADPGAARAMLESLRDRTHEVHSGYILQRLDNTACWSGVHTAVVTMRPYSEAEISAYIASGDPFDKAGGYAIQHPVFSPVQRLDGCFLGVMGLPLCDIIATLRQAGQPIQVDWAGLHAAHQGYPCPVLAQLEPAVP